MLHDDVVGVQRKAAPDAGDARAWGRLPRDGHIRVLDLDLLLFQVDDASDLEDDDPRALCLEGSLERPVSIRVQVGDLDDGAAHSPFGIASIADKLQ